MLKANPNERISSADVVSKINNFNPCDKKKPYAAFLIDRPFKNQVQGRDRFKIAMMNCLRYRLRIALNLEINTENESNSNSEKKFYHCFIYIGLLFIFSHVQKTMKVLILGTTVFMTHFCNSLANLTRPAL
jgi:hypothetical protein